MVALKMTFVQEAWREGIELDQCLARWGLQLSLSLEEDTDNDQIDDSTPDAGRRHGNRNDGNRAARLVGWL